MRKFITDQFLWDVFNAASQAEDALSFLIHPPRRMREIFLTSDDPIYKKYYKILNGKRFSQLVHYLKANNYVRVESLKNKKAIIITKKGLSRTLKAGFKFQERKKRGDGKWIMIIFDIPHNHKKARALLRSILKNLDYKMFQQSVWINPYDILEETERLFQEFSLDKYVKIFLIEEP